MEGIDPVFSAGTECRGIGGTVQEVRNRARALAHSQTLCWPQQPLEGWRRGAVRFSAPRNHGNCASNRAMASAAVSSSTGRAGGGVVLGRDAPGGCGRGLCRRARRYSASLRGAC